jgi:Protein of unknown function (DUF4065)
MADDRLMDLIHYVCWKCEDPSRLGITKLYKILWFSDAWHYRLHGRPITDAEYVKREHGPAPRRGLPAIEELKRRGRIVEPERQGFRFERRDLIALTDADVSKFSPAEISIVDAVIAEVCENYTATSISDFSHDQVWDAARMGEVIPLNAILASVAGEITDDDMAWADDIISKLSNKLPA